MEAVRDKWTDERLDDLNDRVSEGFRRVDHKFDRVDARLDALQREMNMRFDAMQKLMVQLFGGTIAAFLTAAAALFATQL